MMAETRKSTGNKEETTAKIEAVELVLKSFANFRRSELDRQRYLETQFVTNEHIKTYFLFHFDALQSQLIELQKEKKIVMNLQICFENFEI